MQPLSDEEQNNNITNITNDQRIIKKNNKNNEEIKVDKVIFVIILVAFFFFLFCFIIFLVRKTLFKKGYVLMRNKKANELEEEYNYAIDNINYEKEKNYFNKKELEMQIKSGDV